MIEVLKIIKRRYDYKVAPELTYSVNKVMRGDNLDSWKIEVIFVH